MRWSYSSSRSFKQCQKQWFFKNVVASAKSKDPFRRRAYMLSKLQSISAWRGKIVDDVISNFSQLFLRSTAKHRLRSRTPKLGRESFLIVNSHLPDLTQSRIQICVYHRWGIALRCSMSWSTTARYLSRKSTSRGKR